MKIQCGLAKGQVLQRLVGRGASAHLTGTTKETGPVLATLSAENQTLPGWNQRSVGRAVAGQFEARLSGLPSGGPFLLTLECETKRTSTTFFVGDVWLLAGQSNMQGIGNLCGAAKPHSLVRVFTLRREWRLAKDPLHILGESPDLCHNGGRQFSPEAGNLARKGAKGTGLGIFFARERIAQTGVPQGLICTAHGGTSMEQWSPDGKKAGPASLYASMLASVSATGQPVAGVLWYQGESDRGEPQAAQYTAKMQNLVHAARRDLRLPGLPWAIVQLGRVFSQTGNSEGWNSIQEQQRLLPGRIKNLETVAAIDLPMDDHIHIGADGLARLGIRLARAMNHLLEGKGDRPPQFGKLRAARSAIPGECWLEVSFKHVQGKLQASGDPSGFSMLDGKGKTLPMIYRTTLHGDTVRLHYPAVENVHVGYGMGFTPHCNISDERGFSLPVFGPVALKRTRALSAFFSEWATTDILPARIPLGSLTSKHLTTESHSRRVCALGTDGFVNEHACWEGHSGHAFFSAILNLPEAMTLRILMGYDGPFALWVGAKRVFLDEAGANPAVADASNRIIKLAPGRHVLRVAMDLADGAAWGFFLRFERLGLSKTQIASGNFLIPVNEPSQK